MGQRATRGPLCGLCDTYPSDVVRLHGGLGHLSAAAQSLCLNIDMKTPEIIVEEHFLHHHLVFHDDLIWRPFCTLQQGAFVIEAIIVNLATAMFMCELSVLDYGFIIVVRWHPLAPASRYKDQMSFPT